MRYLARLYGKPGTERWVESGDPHTAPDEYVDEHCEVAKGAIFFVDVAEGLGEPWVLWRVESKGHLPGTGDIFFTFKVTPEEAQDEIDGKPMAWDGVPTGCLN